jgi:hypothetical protein
MQRSNVFEVMFLFVIGRNNLRDQHDQPKVTKSFIRQYFFI